MASGREVAKANVEAFSAWVASKTDEDFRSLVHRGQLSRKEVATECGFATSVLGQNPLVKKALNDLEDALRQRGVLPPKVEEPAGEPAPLTREPGKLRGAVEAERLRRLETENAGLKAEVAELKRALEKYVVLSEALAMTGRLPR
jgi:hypothetical protein